MSFLLPPRLRRPATSAAAKAAVSPRPAGVRAAPRPAFIDNRIGLDDFDSYRTAWTEPRICRNNNCYNYVTGCRTSTWAQPGGSENGRFLTVSGSSVEAAAAGDGLKRADASPSTASTATCRLAALFIDSEKPDFHWVLKHPDGTWSHKRGSREPERTDAAGKPITDPRHADLHYAEHGDGDRNFDYVRLMHIPGDVWID